MNDKRDIVERLRAVGDYDLEVHGETDRSDAADEIEWLRIAVSSLEGSLEASRDFKDHYRAAIVVAIEQLGNPYLTLGGVAEV